MSLYVGCYLVSTPGDKVNYEKMIGLFYAHSINYKLVTYRFNEIDIEVFIYSLKGKINKFFNDNRRKFIITVNNLIESFDI